MSWEPYDEKTAPPNDRMAWVLCQIIDDDAPTRWTRYRGVVECLIASENFTAPFIDAAVARSLKNKATTVALNALLTGRNVLQDARRYAALRAQFDRSKRISRRLPVVSVPGPGISGAHMTYTTPEAFDAAVDKADLEATHERG